MDPNAGTYCKRHPGGYTASSPTNDRGVITRLQRSPRCLHPNRIDAALKFFYYKLGDKIFKDFGFVDAFSLEEIWFADSFSPSTRVRRSA
jgi:hypothetical protein